ncbi:Nif11-like leader peptide family natural product precursor [Synechococcus sp. AH-551-N23]|nr:Nif11-like leader peptide family natural product precursor [Synechococcus sp. AH-551-N23]
MSEEQLKAFLEKVKADTSLQEKLKAAGDANAVAAIAKEAGFSISADDLTKAQSELSDQELEGVAGGKNQLKYCWICSNIDYSEG